VNVGAPFATFDKLENHSVVGHPKKGSVVIDLSSKQLTKAIEESVYATYIHSYDTAISEFTYEDGSKDTLSAGYTSAPSFVACLYSGKVDTDVRMLVGQGFLSGDTGNSSTGANALLTSPMQITLKPFTTAVVMPATAFNSAKVTGASKTFVTGEIGSVFHLTAV
jgi:hypothetical protein